MALAKTVQRLAAEVFLNDAALELDAVCAVSGHGLSSFESPAPWSMLCLPTVRLRGRTPQVGQFPTGVDTLLSEPVFHVLLSTLVGTEVVC